VGIVQEQHPDRAQLFMQWQRMDWPVLVDSFNLLGTSVVPITLLIDEHGVVRGSPSLAEAGPAIEKFLAASFDPPPKSKAAPVAVPDLGAMKKAATEVGSADAWQDYAVALGLWGGEEWLDESIAAFRKALEIRPGDGPGHFRLGVAYRMRHDSGRRHPGDFGRAVEQWSRGLDIDPNQYIWRRRIQQYGPRLDKPYPFYDWVVEAREAVEKRGETPVPLVVEPRGAEIAGPARGFQPAAVARREPDPEGRILRDEGKYVRIESTVVPQALRPGDTARVHLEFRPIVAAGTHWNNEIKGLTVWLEPDGAFEVGQRSISLPPPQAAVSDETRTVEFEIRRPDTADSTGKLRGHALYYVCEGIKGACLYRRQDLVLDVPVLPDS